MRGFLSEIAARSGPSSSPPRAALAQSTARTLAQPGCSPARARTESPALSTATDAREADAPARSAPRAATGNSRRATTSTRSRVEGSGRRHSRTRRDTARRVEAAAEASGSAARRRSGWPDRRGESARAPPARRRCLRRRATRTESSRTAVAAAAPADATPRPAPQGNRSRSTRRTSMTRSRRHWRRSQGPSRAGLHAPDSGHRRIPRRAAASRATHRECCRRARHSRPRCSAAPAARART